MNRPHLTGLIAATFTPMNADGSLSLSRVPAIVEHLIGDGVAGLYVCGSTGEGPSLSVSERKATLEAYLSAVNGRIPVVAQVGHDSLTEARELARHAQAAGVTAVSAVPPYYFKPNQTRVVADCVAQIAAAAPDVPFYYYHIPRLTGVSVDIVELAERCLEQVPTFAGIKYSSMALDSFQTLSTLSGGKLNLLFGCDECLLSGLLFGAQGAVGSTYNFAAPIYRRVLAALERGDVATAQKHQAESVLLVKTILKYSDIPALKGLMEIIGVPCGPCRLPLRSLSPEQQQSLRADVLALGLLPKAK
ncbi:MAG TPA: dihydrodipicolinate synthase family protein [Planctomycetaceae bacterium]|nr:dihydrodipicolinate synthase family protein [Planctomycetaceae bacterium]